MKKSNFIILVLSGVIYLANITWKAPDGTASGHSPVGGSSGEPGEGDPSGYVGSAACQSCHKDIYETHIKTAHYLDSRPASGKSIKGSFAEGKNHFSYGTNMKVLLENKNDSFFQTAYLNGIAFESEPFGVVIGSGRKGQTYLYWDDSRLFELPVSYYTPLGAWCSSPGYPTNFISFSKQVHGECLECHGTHASFTEQKNLGTVFDKSSILYGIDCERCHGPGAGHVAFHQAHPNEKKGAYILNARLMSRQQRLDACALCHSGFRQEIRPAFSFMTGDALDAFSRAAYSKDSTSSLDVHGNQYGLLISSKCFKMSDQMDCSSCHDVHVNEANNLPLYSRRCMNCHQDANHNTCSFPPVREKGLTANCIDCHMPALPSQVIFLNLSDAGKSTPDLVRTHHVGIYKEISKDYLKKIKKG